MEETFKLIQEEIDKLIYAFSVALFRYAKAKGVDLSTKESQLKYAVNFQQLWRKKPETFSITNGEQTSPHYVSGSGIISCPQVGINHDSDEKQYSHHQNVILTKLQELKSEQNNQKSLPAVAGYSSEGETDDWFEGLWEVNKSVQGTTVETRHTGFESNIELNKNFVTVLDEIKRKSPCLPTPHHTVCYDEAEHARELVTLKEIAHRNQFSEDSGIFSENYSEKGFFNHKVPNAASNFVHSTNYIKTTVLDSLIFILDHIKSQLDINTKEQAENRKVSPIPLDYTCSVVGECSLKRPEYEEAVKDFIVDLLQDIWSDEKLNQYSSWSQKTCIAKQLLTTPPICHEVLYFLTDIIDSVTKLVKKGLSTAFMISKVALFLELYLITVRTLHHLLKTIDKNTGHKETNVTRLWQEKFHYSSIINGSDKGVLQEIETDIVPKLVEFVISITNKEPLILLIANEVLDELKILCSETHMPQDFLTNMF